jgi:hypothetical protein
MAIETDTHVERIPIADPDLCEAIRQICELQSARDKARRLSAAFVVGDQLILIFQVDPQVQYAVTSQNLTIGGTYGNILGQVPPIQP